MKRFVYYANGGSGNHGCEAIIRSLETILEPKEKSANLTMGYAEDCRYGLDDLVTLYDVKNGDVKSVDFIKSYIELKIRRKKYAMDLFPYKAILRALSEKQRSIALSVGGDNYCYGATDYYSELNNLIRRAGLRTAMVGCSIEPDAINDGVVADLAKHEVVVARESITFNALKNAGLNNIKLLPDPAFRLKVKNVELPPNFIKGNTVGINVSPMVISYGNGGDILMRNTFRLVEYILENTDMNIALIPHVVWGVSDDRSVLKLVYQKYAASQRICMIDDCDAESIKGYIAACRFLITARTHASIAGYSTNVPTLVIGYSVKAKGIARDIFGSWENYVLPTQDIKMEDDLEKSFCWLWANEDAIKAHLIDFMPGYCERLDRLTELLDQV